MTDSTNHISDNVIKLLNSSNFEDIKLGAEILKNQGFNDFSKFSILQTHVVINILLNCCNYNVDNRELVKESLSLLGMKIIDISWKK